MQFQHIDQWKHAYFQLDFHYDKNKELFDCSEDVLEKIISSNDPLQWSAFIALGVKNSAQSLAILLTFVSSNDQFIRRAASKALILHSEGFQHKEIFLHLLTDPSPWVIKTACEGIGLLKTFDFHDDVVKLLAHPDVVVKRAAIESIDKIWEERDLDVILQLYKNATDREISSLAANVLQNHVSSNNWKKLFEIFYQDRLPRNRAWSCKIAKIYANEEVLPYLKLLLNDNDGHVRKSAREAFDHFSP